MQFPVISKALKDILKEEELKFFRERMKEYEEKV